MEFERWLRDDVKALAVSSLAVASDCPLYNTTEWWATMVCSRVRNLELVLAKHEEHKHDTPDMILDLPVDESDDRGDACGFRHHGDAGSDAEQQHDDKHHPDDTSEEEDGMRKVYPPRVSSICGRLPVGVNVRDLVQNSLVMEGKSREALYARSYVSLQRQSDLPFESCEQCAFFMKTMAHVSNLVKPLSRLRTKRTSSRS